MNDHDARLREIETKIAFQERLLESLNDALTGQQRQLEVLQRQLRQVHRIVESREEFGKPEDESPPPHY